MRKLALGKHVVARVSVLAVVLFAFLWRPPMARAADIITSINPTAPDIVPVGGKTYHHFFEQLMTVGGGKDTLFINMHGLDGTVVTREVISPSLDGPALLDALTRNTAGQWGNGRIAPSADLWAKAAAGEYDNIIWWACGLEGSRGAHPSIPQTLAEEVGVVGRNATVSFSGGVNGLLVELEGGERRLCLVMEDNGIVVNRVRARSGRIVSQNLKTPYPDQPRLQIVEDLDVVFGSRLPPRRRDRFMNLLFDGAIDNKRIVKITDFGRFGRRPPSMALHWGVGTAFSASLGASLGYFSAYADARAERSGAATHEGMAWLMVATTGQLILGDIHALAEKTRFKTQVPATRRMWGGNPWNMPGQRENFKKLHNGIDPEDWYEAIGQHNYRETLRSLGNPQYSGELWERPY